jgi:hypothetical protein
MLLRLLLVVIYGVAGIVHTCYMYTKIFQILTTFILQATWTVVLDNFAFSIKNTVSVEEEDSDPDGRLAYHVYTA